MRGPLEHLANTEVTRIFEKHGTRGTWYAHASVGCLHVRPVLTCGSTRTQGDASDRRGGLALVRDYKGSHSGEHGDGSCARNFMNYVRRAARARIEQLKDRFDPKVCSIWQIVRARIRTPACSVIRPAIAPKDIKTHLDWSAYTARAADSRARSRCATTRRLPRARWAAPCAELSRHARERDVTPRGAQYAAARDHGQLGRTRSPPTR